MTEKEENNKVVCGISYATLLNKITLKWDTISYKMKTRQIPKQKQNKKTQKFRIKKDQITPQIIACWRHMREVEPSIEN